jgi:hypothetical protein
MSKAAATWEHVGTLRPDPDNPVIHTDEEVAELQKLIADTVWTEPIVCRREDRQIIAGHRRLAAALLAIEGDPAWKLSDAPKPGTVPVRFVDVTVAQARRLNLASNAMAKQSAWDEEVLGRSCARWTPPRSWASASTRRSYGGSSTRGTRRRSRPPATTRPRCSRGRRTASRGRCTSWGCTGCVCGDNTDPEIVGGCERWRAGGGDGPAVWDRGTTAGPAQRHRLRVARVDARGVQSAMRARERDGQGRSTAGSSAGAESFGSGMNLGTWSAHRWWCGAGTTSPTCRRASMGDWLSLYGHDAALTSSPEDSP